MNAGNLPHTVDDGLQVLEIGYIKYNVDVRLAAGSSGFDVTNIRFRIADHGGDLLQHAPLVVTEERQLDRPTLFPCP